MNKIIEGQTISSSPLQNNRDYFYRCDVGLVILFVATPVYTHVGCCTYRFRRWQITLSFIFCKSLPILLIWHVIHRKKSLVCNSTTEYLHIYVIQTNCLSQSPGYKCERARACTWACDVYSKITRAQCKLTNRFKAVKIHYTVYVLMVERIFTLALQWI